MRFIENFEERNVEELLVNQKKGDLRFHLLLGMVKPRTQPEFISACLESDQRLSCKRNALVEVPGFQTVEKFRRQTGRRRNQDVVEKSLYRATDVVPVGFLDLPRLGLSIAVGIRLGLVVMFSSLADVVAEGCRIEGPVGQVDAVEKPLASAMAEIVGGKPASGDPFPQIFGGLLFVDLKW